MALKPRIRIPFPGKAVPEQGVTLLELIVSIALSSLVAALAFAFFKDAGRVALFTKSRRDMGFQSTVVFNSLCDNLLAGKGVLEVGTGKLVLVNSGDVQLEYRWVDSTLTVNTKPYDFRISELQVLPQGPMRPRGSDGSLDENLPWSLDSLDEDRDGSIDFQELDRNGDQELDLEECRLIAVFRLSLTIVDHNVPMTMSAVIHPRNHFIASRGKRWQVKESNFW